MPRGLPACPAPAGTLDQAQGQRPDGHGQHHRTQDVRDAGHGTVSRVRHQPDGGHQGQDADGDVHQEHPAPGRVDQQAADHGSGSGGEGTDGRPYPHRAHPQLRWGRCQQQPQARRCQRRGSGRLQHPGGDQPPQAGTHCARRAGRGEDRQPRQEARLASEAVGQSTQRHQQGRVHDGVAVEHPTETGSECPRKSCPMSAKANVDDEQVEAGHERGQGEHREHRTGTYRGRRLAPLDIDCHSQTMTADFSRHKAARILGAWRPSLRTWPGPSPTGIDGMHRHGARSVARWRWSATARPCS